MFRRAVAILYVRERQAGVKVRSEGADIRVNGRSAVTRSAILPMLQVSNNRSES